MANTVASLVMLTLCLVEVLSTDIDLSTLPKKVTFPPRIIRQPEKEIAYKIGTGVAEPVELPCIAQGDPTPTYEWHKDGEVIDFTGRTDIKKQPGVGTMIIDEPQESHEGMYQCFAENEHGTAVGVRTILKKATLEPFDTVKDPHVHTPEVGSSLVLRCHPPFSYPTGIVYWGQTVMGKFTSIPTDDRVALDYDGNLYFMNVVEADNLEGRHYVCIVQNEVIRGLVQGDDQVLQPFATPGGNLYFANVLPEDERDGVNYICIASNSVLRGLVQGDDQRIQPDDSSATPRYRAPKFMWSSETTTVAIKGTVKRLKCIFAGYPTPEVTWTRLDGSFSERANPNSEHGLELVISNIDFEDEGQYRCSARNHDDVPPVSRDFDVIVESMPFWVTEPQNVNTAEEEDAEFICEAGGKPRPEVEWLSNGIPWSDLPADSRRLTSNNRIYYRNVTKSDSQVLQCNASNSHGYIFANVYLNVLAEPPTFIKPPEAVTKKAETQMATISCRVFGAPKPVITWKLNDTVLTESRFVKTEDGDLEIHNILLEDRGNYECSAVNKFGQISANGQLVVRERTIITTTPEDQVVNATTDVVFECSATTDPLEFARLDIQWLRDGEEINFENENRLRLNVNDNSLTIIESTVDDSGEYTCVANNGLDSDEVTAQLTVKDKPEAPTDLRNVGCVSTTAEITWEPGNSNNDEIIEFIIYYNTSFDDPGVFHEAKRVSGGTTSTRIRLSPWVHYTFHVRARNNLGVSERSSFTAECTTQPDRPHKHPGGVCVESRDPTQLVIIWEPMGQMDHNGENFHYLVNYKRLDIPNATPRTRRVYDWQASEVIIEDQESFKPYEIYVEAANQIGRAPSNTLTKKKGYSGEGVPTASPTGLGILEDSLNATSAIFTWDPMDTGPEVMKGLFIGYEIHYWRADDPEDVRIHEIVVEPGNLCSDLEDVRGDNRRKRQADAENEAHILDLWPYSEISAGILAKNAGNKGSLSDPFVFSTPEGVPGGVMMLEVRERGSHHFGLAWAPPLEPNGVIVGYDVGFQKTDSALAPIVPQRIDNPLARSTTLKDLDDSTSYRLYIWARTSKGQGEPYFIEDRTLPPGPPDVPGFADMEVGEDSMNVSWTPSQGDDPNNPGTDFYVEYRKVNDGDDAPWSDSRPVDEDQRWTNITGLDHGELYEVRIVAVNGKGVESRSEPRKIRIGPQSEPIVQNLATAGWFIGMMCAIIFLLLILLIVCLIKRNRGGKYPVHEKEKLRGRDPDKDDEEGGFGEYTRTEDPADSMWGGRSRPNSSGDEPDYKKSAGSLESDKPLGSSDEDSMAEYDQMDPSKFNEDGSFIGQYGGKTSKKDEKIDQPDATSPSALSTFV